jgi:hypothetical protein
VKSEWRGKSLESLLDRRAEIGRINEQIFALSQRRGQIERDFLDELAVLLGCPDATLLDSHHVCPESPIERCVFEIVLSTEDLNCIICGGTISR